MQKKKLDLNHLLAKYEGVSNTAYGSPLKQNNQHLIDQEFYQYPQHSRTYQDPHPLPDRIVVNNNQSRTVTGNFTMSKSEVEAFLMSLREDIRGEERAINKQVEASLRVLLDNFQRVHERLRRELLEMLDRSFAENQRIIRDELARQSKTESPQFAGVFRRISTIDQDIERMLGSLRTPEYRRTIAEVVTRDFAQEINDLRGLATNAKNSYIQSLGEVECDRAKIEAIRDSLQKLFFINRKTIQSSTVNNQHIHEIGSGIFSMARDRASEPVAQSRTRKSFFNFGSD